MAMSSWYSSVTEDLSQLPPKRTRGLISRMCRSAPRVSRDCWKRAIRVSAHSRRPKSSGELTDAGQHRPRHRLGHVVEVRELVRRHLQVHLVSLVLQDSSITESCSIMSSSVPRMRSRKAPPPAASIVSLSA